MSVDVFVADEQSEEHVEPDVWLALARQVLEAEGVVGDAELSLLFVDSNSIAELNSRFLGREGPTDVLAFPIDEEPFEGGRFPDSGGPGPGWSPADSTDMPLLLGDVVVCPRVAAANARERDSKLEDEIALLVVHGILHLRGYDHEEDDAAEAMEARERDLLSQWRRSAGTAGSASS